MIIDFDQLAHEQIVISACRYAIGRRTYIVSTTVDYVLRAIEKGQISRRAQHVIARDIQECDDLGDQTDIDNWNKLLDVILENNI